jgi:hypothetical protein
MMRRLLNKHKRGSRGMCTLKLLYSGDERGLWNEMDGWAGSPCSRFFAWSCVCVCVCDGQTRRGGDDPDT